MWKERKSRRVNRWIENEWLKDRKKEMLAWSTKSIRNCVSVQCVSYGKFIGSCSHDKWCLCSYHMHTQCVQNNPLYTLLIRFGIVFIETISWRDVIFVWFRMHVPKLVILSTAQRRRWWASEWACKWASVRLQLTISYLHLGCLNDESNNKILESVSHTALRRPFSPL